MLSVNIVNANCVEVFTKEYIVGFSYKEAVFLQEISTGRVMKTGKKWSQTTSRHISTLLKMRSPAQQREAETVEQEYIDAIVAAL